MARTSPSKSDTGVAHKQTESKLWKTLGWHLSQWGKKTKTKVCWRVRQSSQIGYSLEPVNNVCFCSLLLWAKGYIQSVVSNVNEGKKKVLPVVLYFYYLWEVQSYQQDLGRHSVPPSDIYPNYQIQHISSTVWTSDSLPGTCTDKEVYFQLLMQEMALIISLHCSNPVIVTQRNKS